MRIPNGVAKFRKWARKTRISTNGIIGIGACVVYNLSVGDKDPDHRSIQRVLAIVAEECAIRWDKAASR